jgi:tetratricopeptide (TPR) repeat protein
MGIKGDVKSLSLANVLQDLAMNEQTGTLAIRHRERQVALWFEKGALRLVGLGQGEGPSLLNGLLALQKIGPDEAPAVTGRKTSEGAFVRALLKKGRVTRDDLKAACEQQMAEHLCDAFLWVEATFEFEEGQPDDRLFDVDQIDYEPRLAVDAVIMEALRRADEWGETRKAILSSNEILVVDPQRLPREADPTVRRVFGLLDGERSLKEVQDLTRMGQFVLMRAAALLIRAGAARNVTAAEALERGRARAAKKDWPAAMRMARYGLDHERKNTALLELALRCAEAAEDDTAAASYARQLASVQVESGQGEAAIKSYHRVLAHAPRDLTAHERLFEILLGMDLKLDALAQGEALAEAYKKAGLSDKALAVFQRLVETVGDHTELLESVAEIQRRLGDKAEAVKVYARLLERAVGQKNDQAALDYARTILRIDPRHAGAQKLRQDLESGQIERARRRRRLVKGLVTAGVLGAFVFTAVVYEYRARLQYAAVANPVLVAMSDGNHREALRLFDTVLDPYRWSVKARELRPQRELVEEKFAEEELASAGTEEKHGQLPPAVEILEEALRSVRRGDLRGRLEKRLADLRQSRAKEERRWDDRLRGMAPKDIELQNDPLAVPALVKLLSHREPAVRAAATGALGSIKGEAAIEGLFQALSDTDPAVTARAATILIDKGRHPFRASLAAARPSFPPGESAQVEWRLMNLGPGEVEILLESAPAAGLRVTGPNGPVALPPRAAGRRVWRLAPGEGVVGGFPELASLVLPGKYELRWKAAVTWNGKVISVEAPAVSLERTR